MSAAYAFGYALGYYLIPFLLLAAIVCAIAIPIAFRKRSKKSSAPSNPSSEAMQTDTQKPAFKTEEDYPPPVAPPATQCQISSKEQKKQKERDARQLKRQRKLEAKRHKEAERQKRIQEKEEQRAEKERLERERLTRIKSEKAAQQAEKERLERERQARIKAEEQRIKRELEIKETVVSKSPRLQKLREANRKFKREIKCKLYTSIKVSMADIPTPGIIFGRSISLNWVIARAVHENVRELKEIDRASNKLYAAYSKELKKLPNFSLSGDDGELERSIFDEEVFNKEDFAPDFAVWIDPGHWKVGGYTAEELRLTNPIHEKLGKYTIESYDRLWLSILEMPGWKETFKNYKVKNNQFAQKQRSLVKPGLRYDIFKRDNFRCQICGATQADGAKLHVDHIVPVSKGGKTEWSNLRTLCDRCNLGKGSKIENVPSKRTQGGIIDAIWHNL